MKIGLSACFFHRDDQRPIFKGKTLLYYEESMAHWFLQHDSWPVLVPRTPESVSIEPFLDYLDGMVLTGGTDVAPSSYGATSISEKWPGDPVRDQYDINLIKRCLARNIPILAICRGIQIANVALGGTLYQDIETQVEGAKTHRDWNVYDQLFHEARIVPGSTLSALYPGSDTVTINSIHHQAIQKLGQGLTVEATSLTDGITEAVFLPGNAYLRGVQWHPEFQTRADRHLLDRDPIMNDFLGACRDRRS